MTYHGTGRAKLLLFGEHAAVYGYPAVGLALSEATTVTLTPARTASWIAPDLPADYRPWFDLLRAALDTELARLYADTTVQMIRGRIDINSDIPVSRGFGSSATLCVALAEAVLRALVVAGGLPEDAVCGDGRGGPGAVWQLANRLERVFHGTPSGIDTGLAAREGLSAFFFEGGELPRAEAIPAGRFTLVTASVPRSVGTRELIAAIRRRVTSGDERTTGLLRDLGELARQAIVLIPAAVDRETIIRLGQLANRAHQRLTELGLGDPNLDRYLDIGRSAGASGGKLSGAGGGGAFYLVCHTPAVAQTVARKLVHNGLVDETVRIVKVEPKKTGRPSAPYRNR